MHQPIVNILHICRLRNRKTFLQDDATGINIVVEEEGGNTRLLLAINHCPVDRRRTAILRKEGCMYIKCTIFRHRPNHLWQHAESNYHLQVSLIRAQLLYKLRVLHLYRLQNWQTLGKSILLHLRRLQRILVSAHRFIGLGNHSHHIITTLYQALEGFHRKLRCSHENNSQILLLHKTLIF